jgi:hypothetical protein
MEALIVRRLASGQTINAIAKALHKKFPRRAVSTWRYHILRTVGRSEWVQQELAMVGRSELMGAVPGAAAGVGRMSKRGRTDAAKLIFEATGFHNPRVKHEHSGDVSITLNIPRPQPVVNEDGYDVVDADVVE